MKKIIILGSFLLIGALALTGCATKTNVTKKLSPDEAKTKTEQFINTYLMQSGSKAKVSDVTPYNQSLYKVKVDIGNGQTVDSYVTVDGTQFFPQALSMTDIAKQGSTTQDNTATTPAAEVKTKTDKPVVELFVMSYCPFGTQIEKGMLPVIDTLGNKMDFQLKFVSYSMHEKKEIDENLIQYCIQKDTPAKLAPYLKCFLAAEGQGPACLKSNNLNVDKCVKDSDVTYKVTANYNDKTTWKGNFPPFDVNKADNEKYNVGGSPTLIINGEEIQTNRDSSSLLKTICSAFKTAPKECSASLSSASPSSGFGFNTAASSNSAAGCVQ
ncbi:MAG: hypothetical protein NTX66_02665 [Candidatus Falkowbacteria bacterium]|nr:hypothetical protein [Candidatus Falkowbacteria bacterium]